MAQRRMFSLKIIDTDKFLDMPMTSQLLYFHLSMRADDEGFISNPKKIQRIIGCADDDFKVLLTKKFIIPFESGICVIKDWKIHNYIQKDRYSETLYLEEKKQLHIDKSGSYKKCIQNVSKVDTQVRLELGKDRLEIEKENNILHAFNFFWNLYPRKIEKIKAFNKFKKIVKNKKKYYEIIISVENYNKYCTNKPKEYIKHCSTWLTNWEDWRYLTDDQKEEIIINNKKLTKEQIENIKNFEKWSVENG